MHFLRQAPSRKLRLLPLIAATYFMVSGGPYGIEDILGGAGFGLAILILVILPLIWSLPTALMIGELASAIPAEGGFYVWVYRAMGPFWGYQESWLSLTASIFDMALYPSIFVLYLGKFMPALTMGWHGYAWSLAVVLICSLWNLRGASAVGEGSVWLCALLLASWPILLCIGVALLPSIPLESVPAQRSRLQFLSQCGITWAGTTLPPSLRRLRIRSEIIPAP
jgi:amino acid transporter